MKVKDMVKKLRKIKGNIPILVSIDGNYIEKLTMYRESDIQTLYFEFDDDSSLKRYDTELVKSLLDYLNKITYVSLFSNECQFMDYEVVFLKRSGNKLYTPEACYIKNIENETYYIIEVKEFLR